MRRMLILMLLGALFVACGGDGDTDATPVGQEQESPTLPAATPGSTSTNGGDEPSDGAEDANSTIRYTGAHSGEFPDEGSCGGGVSGDGLQLFISAYDDDTGVTWIMQMAVSQYTGPGQYEVGDSLVAGGSVTFGDTVITLGNNSGGNWGSTRDEGGTVSINADEKSGTVDATLMAEDGSSQLQVVGEWTCSAS